jgi:pimeloyl-ACP methyl ester carboxylesterase
VATTSQGAELHHYERGTGEPVLLIHGSGPDGDSWIRVADALAERGRRAIAYDRRGFSRSPGPPTADLTMHAADAAGLLERLDARQATVATLSFGGLVGLQLAVDRPELVSALVLAEPPLHGRKHMTPGLARAFLTARARRLLGGEQEAGLGFMRWCASYPDGGSVFDRPDYPPERRAAAAANSPALFAEQKVDDSRLDVRSLGALLCPVTLLLGELSPSWFERCVKGAQGLIPQARIEKIPGAGHGMTFEQPAAVADAIVAAGR